VPLTPVTRSPSFGAIPPGHGADLLDREACRDGDTELARRDQASNLLYGAGGGVSRLPV
jgi:hypothetical protein